MNWGKKITVVYLAFVALIVTMVVISARQKVDLVSSDYYAKELNYQADIDKMKNANALNSKLKCSITNNTIELIFPDEHQNKSITGKAFVYKPSDNKSDKVFPINTFEGREVISTQDLTKGMYKVKVDWNVEGKEYQTESVIVIQ